MADITRLSRLVNGIQRHVDLQQNALIVGSLKVGTTSPAELTKTILSNLINLQNGSDFSDGSNSHTHDGRYFTETELGSNSNGEGASLIGIEDANTQFTSTDVEGALDEAMDAAQAAQSDVDNLETAVGNSNATNMGTYTGSIITDNQTAKQNIQELETYAENTRSLVNNFEWYNSALDYITDNTSAPPTEVEGDRYILSHDGGSPHADWDGASAGDVVEFDGSSWVATTPSTGVFISVDDDTSGMYNWGGSSWSFKSFEATTASGGLSKTGYDISIAATGVTAAKLGSDVAGTGLTGGNGSAIDIDFSTAFNDTKAVKASDLASTDNGKGASIIGVEDTGSYFTGTDVEAILQEIGSAIADIGALTANETPVAGLGTGLRAVRWGVTDLDTPETAGKIYNADPTESSLVKTGSNKDPFYVIGIIDSDNTTGSQKVYKSGSMTKTSHGLAVGEPFYLGDSGVLTNTAPTTASEAVVKLGTAKDANTLDIQIQIMGVN